MLFGSTWFVKSYPVNQEMVYLNIPAMLSLGAALGRCGHGINVDRISKSRKAPDVVTSHA